MEKVPVGVCILDCFMWLSLPCFFTFCCSAIPTSCYIFNVFITCITGNSMHDTIQQRRVTGRDL